MTTAVERAEFAPDEPIGLMTLARGAARRVRAAGLPMLFLWVALAATTLGLGYLVGRMTPAGGGLTLAMLSVIGLRTAVVATCGAVALRLLLGERLARLRPDRGFWECAALLAAAEIALDGSIWFVGLMVARADNPTVLALRGLAPAILGPVISLLLIRLALWPVGRLQGRGDMTARRAWVLMRGATLSYALACLIVGVTYVGMLSGATLVGVQNGGHIVLNTPAFGVVNTFAGTAWSLYGLALAAAVYGLRVESGEAVADVFD